LKYKYLSHTLATIEIKNHQNEITNAIQNTNINYSLKFENFVNFLK